MVKRDDGGLTKISSPPPTADVKADNSDVPESQTDASDRNVPEHGNPANLAFWHVPESQKRHVPESAIEADNGDVPESEAKHVPEIDMPGWRIEVTNGGIYWQWRKGSHGNRQARKGGKFQTLNRARQEQYEQNKREHHNRKQRAQGRRGQSKRSA